MVVIATEKDNDSYRTHRLFRSCILTADTAHIPTAFLRGQAVSHIRASCALRLPFFSPLTDVLPSVAQARAWQRAQSIAEICPATLGGSCFVAKTYFATLRSIATKHERRVAQEALNFAGRFLLCKKWRRGRESNPRYPFGAHTISSRTPSATRSPLQNQ